jgi:hypothetical protein
MILTFAWTIIATLAFLFLFAYFPGKVISQKSKLPNWADLHVAIGIATLTLVSFFLSFVIPAKIFLPIYLLAFALLGFKWKVNIFPRFKKIKINYLLISILILGTISQSWFYVQSLLGGLDNLALNLYINHDQAWHASLIYELSQNFPPHIPGFSGQILKNYHYFYDLLVSLNYSLLGGKVIYYIQFIYPILISAFFGISIFRVSGLLFKNNISKLTVLFLAYFANNLAYLLPFFNISKWQSDSFLIDQPIIYMFNQQTVLSIAIILYLLILISFGMAKKNLGSVLASGLLIAFLINLKIYGFLALVFCLTIYFMYRLIKNRNLFEIKTLFLIGVFALVICLAIYFLSFDVKQGFLGIKPGWIINEFFHKTIYPISSKIASWRQILIVNNNWLKLGIINFVFLIIFLIANFNVRLFSAFYIFKKNKSELGKLILILTLVSLAILFIGNQKGSPHNIIQFAPYAIAGTTILSGTIIENISKKKIKYLIAALMILLSIPTSIKTMSQFRIAKFNTINYEIIETLTFLKNQPRGIIASLNVVFDLLSPYRKDRYADANLMGAITGYRTYFFDKNQLSVLNIDYNEREKFNTYIFKNIDKLDKNDFVRIKNNNIKYLIIDRNKHDPDKLSSYLNKIYLSENYAIYEVK